MTDRPIIFSATMVNALLAGRKTMTRRILKRQPETFLVGSEPCRVELIHLEGEPLPRVALGNVITRQEVRYAVGDRLWVRENHRLTDCECTEACRGAGHVWYEATSEGYRNVAGNKLRPSIHMPRYASRLTLIVNGVKVEKLQDISEADAMAEGCKAIRDHCHVFEGTGYDKAGLCHSAASTAFSILWDEINGPGAWDANPYVVAVSFRVVKANIDSDELRCAA